MNEIVCSQLGAIKICACSGAAKSIDGLYIHEFLGAATPPAQLRALVSHYIVLPGDAEADLARVNLAGDCYSWKVYGKAVASVIKEVRKPVKLLGNSMGAMVALYATMEEPDWIEHLTLYKVPTFGLLREPMRQKYAHVAASIVSSDTFDTFVSRIEPHIERGIVQTLKSMEWETAKKLYEGAASSDLETSCLPQLAVPISFLEDSSQEDEAHPKQAQTQLYQLLTGTESKKIIKLGQQ